MKILNRVSSSFFYKGLIDKYYNEDIENPEIVIYSLDEDVSEYVGAKKIAVYSKEDEIDLTTVEKNYDKLLTDKSLEGFENTKIINWPLMDLILRDHTDEDKEELVSSIINVFSSNSTTSVKTLLEDAEVSRRCDEFGYVLCENTKNGIGENSIVTDLDNYKEVMPFQIYMGFLYGQSLVIPKNLLEFVASSENKFYPPVYTWNTYPSNFVGEAGDTVFKHLQDCKKIVNRTLLKFGFKKIGITQKDLEKKLRDSILH